MFLVNNNEGCLQSHQLLRTHCEISNTTGGKGAHLEIGPGAYACDSIKKNHSFGEWFFYSCKGGTLVNNHACNYWILWWSGVRDGG